MKKNIASITVVTILVLGLSAMAFAGPGNGRGGYGPCGGNPGYAQPQLTPEQQTAAQKIFDDYQPKIQELRDMMWAKNTELNALVRSGNAQRADIEQLTGQIVNLRKEMRTQHEALGKALEKAGIASLGYGNCPRSGRGMGQGMMGNGDGFGRHHGYGMDNRF